MKSFCFPVVLLLLFQTASTAFLQPAGTVSIKRRGEQWQKSTPPKSPPLRWSLVDTVAEIASAPDASSWLARHVEQTSTQPLTLSLFAGLSTCLGAAVVFFAKDEPLSDGHMAFCLSLAGSVMVTVTLISVLPESFQDATTAFLPTSLLLMERFVSFAMGCSMYLLLSRYAFPEPETMILGFEDGSSGVQDMKETRGERKALPRIESQSQAYDRTYHNSESHKTATLRDSSHNHQTTKDLHNSNWLDLRRYSSGSDLETEDARRSWRITVLLFVSLAVHNFPEGLAVAASAMHSPQLGITTAVAIALHNIPEGIAIAVPCLAARPDAPWLAFWLASLSGLAEPLGAFVTISFLGSHASFQGMADVLAFVGGIMITVACFELFPEALRHSQQQRFPIIAGLVSGAVIMTGSEAFLSS